MGITARSRIATIWQHHFLVVAIESGPYARME
jgi:hypothetical protein